MKLKNIFLPLVGLGLFMSSFFVAADTVTCDSVSMTASATSTGNITCQAHGHDNITVDTAGVISYGAGINFGSAPIDTGDLLASFGTDGGTNAQFTISGGTFIVGSSVWSSWKSIYVAIKQASGNGQAGGGWGLFLLSSVVDGGNYATKLNATSEAGISHVFAVGGEKLSEVPLPAAVWLFGSAFAGLMGVARKRTKVA